LCNELDKDEFYEKVTELCFKIRDLVNKVSSIGLSITDHKKRLYFADLIAESIKSSIKKTTTPDGEKYLKAIGRREDL
jgi:hypothetical protein